MPPRLNIWGAYRALAVRSQPLTHSPRPRIASAVAARGLANDASNLPPRPPGEGDFSGIPPSMAGTSGSSGESSAAQAEAVDAGRVQGSLANQEALSELELLAQGLDPFDPALDGHRFPLPATPLGPQTHLKNRYDPNLAQLTRLLMHDGKLSKAQRVRS